MYGMCVVRSLKLSKLKVSRNSSGTLYLLRNSLGSGRDALLVPQTLVAVLNLIAPAIANAIYNAIGVRINRLPLNAERVFNVLKVKTGGSNSV